MIRAISKCLGIRLRGSFRKARGSRAYVFRKRATAPSTGAKTIGWRFSAPTIFRLIEEPGEISCVFQFGGFCCAHDSSWWLPQRRRSQQADRVGARWVGGLSRDAPRQRLGAFA